MMIRTGAYERFGQPLTLLAGDALLHDALAVAGAESSWWRPERRWRRHYGRFTPEQASFAILVFETVDAPQELCQVEVFNGAVDLVSDSGAWIGASAAGVLRIRRFPSDVAMPNLANILACPGQPRVVRYRPGRRCTLRFDHLANGAPGYAKVFADHSAEAVHRAGKALWDGASAGAIDFAVARPLRWDRENNTLWQGSVPGVPVISKLFAPGGGALAFRMGRALGTLPASGLRSDAVVTAEVQLDRTRRYASRLIQRVPQLKDAVADLIAHLAARHSRLPTRKPVPIHGAPHVHQWLVDGEALGLVDFDRFALGDAELDAATFLGEIDFEDPEKVPVAEISRAFIAGYESSAGALDGELLALYRAHKRFAMACHAAQAMRPDGARRALKRLRRAAEGIIPAAAPAAARD